MEETANTGSEEEQDVSPEKEPDTTDTKEVKEVDTSQKETDKLQKELKQARDLQAQADKRANSTQRELKKIQRQLERSRNSKEEFTPQTEEEETTTDTNKLLAEKGITQLILSKEEYQQVLNSDQTLKEVLLSNPLALVQDYYSAEDAIEQIREKLDERVANLQSSLPKEEEKKEEKKEEEKVETVTPNPSGEGETPLQKGDVEGSILSRIRVK